MHCWIGTDSEMWASEIVLDNTKVVESRDRERNLESGATNDNLIKRMGGGASSGT